MLALIAFIGIIIFLYWGNNGIVVSKYNYSTDKISISLNGFKILHISDFHNKNFGKGGKRLIEKIINQNPNLIVITGDIIDRRRYNLDIALNLCERLIEIAPVYYVSGNHEAWSKNYKKIIFELKCKGVIILEDEVSFFEFNNEKIEIFGIKENMEKRGGLSTTSIKNLEKHKLISMVKSNFSILLSHRPELFPLYQSYPFDLVFTGHVHGGQIRLPFIGAFFGPDQGWFPLYDSGKYTENNQTMFLSRGLGNSIFPIRILNRPELIVVELKYTT